MNEINDLQGGGVCDLPGRGVTVKYGRPPGWVLQKNWVGGILWEISGDRDDACAERDIVGCG